MRFVHARMNVAGILQLIYRKFEFCSTPMFSSTPVISSRALHARTGGEFDEQTSGWSREQGPLFRRERSNSGNTESSYQSPRTHDYNDELTRSRNMVFRALSSIPRNTKVHRIHMLHTIETALRDDGLITPNLEKVLPDYLLLTSNTQDPRGLGHWLLYRAPATPSLRLKLRYDPENPEDIERIAQAIQDAIAISDTAAVTSAQRGGALENARTKIYELGRIAEQVEKKLAGKRVGFELDTTRSSPSAGVLRLKLGEGQRDSLNLRVYAGFLAELQALEDLHKRLDEESKHVHSVPMDHPHAADIAYHHAVRNGELILAARDLARNAEEAYDVHEARLRRSEEEEGEEDEGEEKDENDSNLESSKTVQDRVVVSSRAQRRRSEDEQGAHMAMALPRLNGRDNADEDSDDDTIPDPSPTLQTLLNHVESLESALPSMQEDASDVELTNESTNASNTEAAHVQSSADYGMQYQAIVEQIQALQSQLQALQAQNADSNAHATDASHSLSPPNTSSSGNQTHGPPVHRRNVERITLMRNAARRSVMYPEDSEAFYNALNSTLEDRGYDLVGEEEWDDALEEWANTEPPRRLTDNTFDAVEQ